MLISRNILKNYHLNKYFSSKVIKDEVINNKVELLRKYDNLLSNSKEYINTELDEIKKSKIFKKNKPGWAKKYTQQYGDLTYYGFGKRKSAKARVWLKQGSGENIVNNRLSVDYFLLWKSRNCFVEPFEITNTLGQYDVYSKVKGGGIVGQAEAIQLAISRALVNINPSFRKPLRTAYLLKQDIRKKERKKPGRKKLEKNFNGLKDKRVFFLNKLKTA